jgi:hypothetical protein
MKRQVKIHFICSPSLGIMDNWLPVLLQLRAVSPALQISIVFPKAGILDQVYEENVVIKFASEVINEVLFISETGNWYKHPGFKEAIKHHEQLKLPTTLYNIQKKLSGRRLTSIFSKSLMSVLRTSEKNKHMSLVDINQEMKSTSAILMDIVEEQKAYNWSFLKLLGEVKKFSLCHGININTDPIVPKRASIRRNGEVTSYLFSLAEKTYYQKSFLLAADDLKVLGIPRHENFWIKKILSHFKTETFPKKDFVFLISRPVSDYLPLARKRKALEDIKRVIIQEKKLAIVVKTHPKEPDDGLFEEVFGNEQLGHTWFKNHAHPYAIGENCLFAVSFYSGVAVDMLYLKKPTIEYLNLNDLPKFDHSRALRDDSRDVVFSYRHYGLVLGVSDIESLRQEVTKVMENRDQVIERLIQRYSELFPDPAGSIRQITEDILRVVDLR